MASDKEDKRIGSVIQGRYRIMRRLAVGSMGVVYRAQRIHLDRPVAIKFLHTTAAKDEMFRKRFEIEARTMSQLSHPNCISVIDFGVTDAPYIVMDLVRGYNLKELADRAPIDPARAVRIVRQLLAGLAHAHKRGIVHRDIKPANVMLSEATCAGDQVKVFDFGLAKVMGLKKIIEESTDTVAGTLNYMSPEHVRGGELDGRADLFSTGVVLYELLTGLKPFRADSPTDIFTMHDVEPPRLRDALPTTYFSQELDETVAKSIARVPSFRFQSAEEFAVALDAVPEADPRWVRAVSLAPHTGTDDEEEDVSETMPAPARTAGKRFALLVAATGALLALGMGGWLMARSSLMGGPAVTGTASVTGIGASGSGAPAQNTAVSGPDEKTEGQSERDDGQSGDGTTLVFTEPIGGEEDLDGVSIAEVYALIKRKKRAAAIDKLLTLMQRNPKNAYYHLLLGNLYSAEKQWPKAVRSYEEAIGYEDDYRFQRVLINNVARALADNRSHSQASELILNKIGKRALPDLRRISARRDMPRLRSRARELVAILTAKDKTPAIGSGEAEKPDKNEDTAAEDEAAEDKAQDTAEDKAQDKNRSKARTLDNEDKGSS